MESGMNDIRCRVWPLFLLFINHVTFTAEGKNCVAVFFFKKRSWVGPLNELCLHESFPYIDQVQRKEGKTKSRGYQKKKDKIEKSLKRYFHFY